MKKGWLITLGIVEVVIGLLVGFCSIVLFIWTPHAEHTELWPMIIAAPISSVCGFITLIIKNKKWAIAGTIALVIILVTVTWITIYLMQY